MPCRAVPCHAIPCHTPSPRSPLAPKEGLSPRRGPTLDPSSDLGPASPSRDVAQKPRGPSQWRCGALGKFFPGKKVDAVAGQRFRGNLKPRGRGFCHSDKDLRRRIRYHRLLVFHCAGNNESVQPLWFISTVRKMEGKKAKC